MAKSTRAKNAQPSDVLDWTGVRTQRVKYARAARIFAQGEPAASVMYVEEGAVRLSVLSHSEKEAVVAVLDAGYFFGEGCLAGQSQRMATATAMAPCTILTVEKQDMVRQLHAQPAFADRFLAHMLTRNIRIEEDRSLAPRAWRETGEPLELRGRLAVGASGCGTLRAFIEVSCAGQRSGASC